MQEMEFTDETTKRQSSVVSSEASSKISVSSGSRSGYDYEIQSSVLKKKSSSLSCLPDRISDFFDQNTSTLPPNLDAVKAFEENLLPKGASWASCYKTAECLVGQDSEEELSSNDGQRSSFDLNVSLTK